MTEKATRPRYTENVRVRLTEHERRMLEEMLAEESVPSASAFLRSLVLREARRRGKLAPIGAPIPVGVKP